MKSAVDLVGKHVHFVGVGGAGMSGIARIMIAVGAQVSGSDLKLNSVTDNLSTLGAKIYQGHSAENLQAVDLMIVSSAIDERNPEVKRAIESGTPIISRAAALALLMNGRRSVAVAGTHGKTTTTSMLTVALQHAAADPSFAIGGMINSSGTNAYLGKSDIFVAEADESDGSFLVYQPFGAIITNIELDHVDNFGTLADIERLFLDFLETIQPGGFIVACNDDPGVRELLSAVKRTDLQIITYGKNEAEYLISRIALEPTRSFARLSRNGSVLGELELSVVGEHNILNAVAALASGIALGLPASLLMEGLTSFSGSRRRFELKGEAHGVRVIDDYGHHPTEIRVTLDAARRYAQGGRLIVLFQPHRYTRTEAFSEEFAQALTAADSTFLLEIYAASEEPIPGVSSLRIAQSMQKQGYGSVVFEPSMLAAVEAITAMVEPGDVVITMGAGDVSSIAPVLVKSIAERQ